MIRPVLVDVLILHLLDRTHVTDLRGQVLVELVTEQKNPDGQMRNTNGVRLESRFHLGVGKWVIDVTDMNADI